MKKLFGFKKVKYQYILSEPYIFHLDHSDKWQQYYNQDWPDANRQIKLVADNKVWANISPLTDEVMIRPGYAWDGCTPQYELTFFGKKFRVGVPEGKLQTLSYWTTNTELFSWGTGNRIRKDTVGPATMYAALEHDLWCQFRKDIPPTVPWSAPETSFLIHLDFVDFKLATVYHAATYLYQGIKHGKIFAR